MKNSWAFWYLAANLRAAAVLEKLFFFGVLRKLLQIMYI